jgi:aspartate-semialdehyde dehydrogenase
MKLGIVGWRGMVGTILLERLVAEGDLRKVSRLTLYSTSQGGERISLPSLQDFKVNETLADAYEISSLKEEEIIISAQGSDYTNKVYQELRAADFKGYWIDAASALRMKDDAIIVLDPVNRSSIDKALNQGIRTFVGGNCTVSLLLMALTPLFQRDEIEWLTTSSYQAVSGAGASAVLELLSQINNLSGVISNNAKLSPLTIAEICSTELLKEENSTLNLGAPIALNLIPFIDKLLPNGQSKEEWKGSAEGSKILGKHLNIDGLCVRVGSVRSHAQGITFKMRDRSASVASIEQALTSSHQWLKLIPNSKEDSANDLTPLKVSGTLNIALGRLRNSTLGDGIFHAFTVGDQLLWGAAEPLRRTLAILTHSL